jgi:hypothetical protein
MRGINRPYCVTSPRTAKSFDPSLSVGSNLNNLVTRASRICIGVMHFEREWGKAERASQAAFHCLQGEYTAWLQASLSLAT